MSLPRGRWGPDGVRVRPRSLRSPRSWDASARDSPFRTGGRHGARAWCTASRLRHCPAETGTGRRPWPATGTSRCARPTRADGAAAARPTPSERHGPAWPSRLGSVAPPHQPIGRWSNDLFGHAETERPRPGRPAPRVLWSSSSRGLARKQRSRWHPRDATSPSTSLSSTGTKDEMSKSTETRSARASELRRLAVREKPMGRAGCGRDVPGHDRLDRSEALMWPWPGRTSAPATTRPLSRFTAGLGPATTFAL